MQPSIAHLARHLAAEKGISLADAQRIVVQLAARATNNAPDRSRPTPGALPRGTPSALTGQPTVAQIARRLSAQTGIALGEAQCLVVRLAAKARDAVAGGRPVRWG